MSDSKSPTTTEHRCGTCRHWARIDGEAGNCWPKVPFWMTGLHEAGCATWAAQGADCQAWSPKA